MTFAVSEDPYINRKRLSVLKRRRLFVTSIVYIFGIFAVLCIIGMIVSVLMLNFGARNAHKDLILYILAGCSVGGAALFAVGAVLLSRLMSRASDEELDFRERMDGEESFFVGTGTLATFHEKELVLHSETDKTHDSVHIPYSDLKFLSVCTRRRPKEKGEWSVVIEIPVKYLLKEGAEKDDGKPVLVQTDAKERLLNTLERHKLALGGEKKSGDEKTKFTRLKKFCIPDKKKRLRSLIFLVLGVALMAGGVCLAIFKPMNSAYTLGAAMGAAGVFFTARASVGYYRAKAVYSVYKEGFYTQESGMKNCMFVKWGDITEIAYREDGSILFTCLYGKYEISVPEAAYSYTQEVFTSYGKGENE